MYLGGPVRMLQLFAGGIGRELLMGSNILGGQEPRSSCQPASGRARCSSQALKFALLGATMAPGFDYADYEQGRRAELLAHYPSHAAMITRLTRR